MKILLFFEPLERMTFSCESPPEKLIVHGFTLKQRIKIGERKTGFRQGVFSRSIGWLTSLVRLVVLSAGG
jgi:hypothetical protein